MAKSEVKSLAAQADSTLDIAEMDNSAGALAVVSTAPTSWRLLFAQPKAIAQWSELKAQLPNLADGDAVLQRPQPLPPLILSPLRLTFIDALQYWLQKTSAGQPIPGTYTTKNPAPGSKTPRGWFEEIIACCIVYLPTSVGTLEAVPCSALFKTVKCSSAATLVLGIKASSKLDWAGLSERHKAAFAFCVRPYLRVVGVIKSQPPRTGASGNPYVASTCHVEPSGAPEWTAVQKLLEDPGDVDAVPSRPSGKDRLRAANQSFRSRIADLGLAQS